VHGLPHDWEEQVIRAYTVFGIDPSTEYGVDDLLRGARRYWTTARRRIKAVDQLRAPKGHDDAGRWVPGPRTTLPGDDIRGKINEGIDAWEPPHMDAVPLKRTITQEQFDAALGTLIHSDDLPRLRPMSEDPELIAALLTQWVRTSKQFELAPGVGVGTQKPSRRGDDDVFIEIPGREGQVNVSKNAKRLVSQNLSDATAGTIPTETLQKIAAQIKIGSGGLEVEWLHTGERLPTDQDPTALPGVSGWVQTEKKPWILYAIPEGVPPEQIPHYIVENENRIMRMLRALPIPLTEEQKKIPDGPPPQFHGDWAAYNEHLQQTNELARPESFEYAATGTPELDTMLRDHYISRMVGVWAGTSNDNDSFALAMQEAAKDLLPESAAPSDLPLQPQTQENMEMLLEEHQAELVEFLTAQHRLTQDLLTALDVDGVRLYRGGSTTAARLEGSVAPEDTDLAAGDWGEKNDGLSRPFQTSATQRPMSSWATDPDIGRLFAATLETGVILPGAFSWLLGAPIPADEILSTTLTGYGAFNEAEMVVLSALRDIIAVRSPRLGWPSPLRGEELAMLLREAAQLGPQGRA
jgi:hypothetical protein